ncbi:probable xyloglucan endotransglucosylase/hydrolase protein 27 isoform X2 [Dioscorea cayenensis subsp. rotundata]|uniref:Xyloglucan endotransglucosylase/hydrolase n=1 Tax=Dioscorea cayennensis subsp. rotundata TaxID=55577 RepID=A0AB40BCL1_DIOCR|nr:probable xyloglucan endotransglucosylase/hydrolase protein 27 isoform X2 [Dioscorea cayenensis subsp. rotundata]
MSSMASLLLLTILFALFLTSNGTKASILIQDFPTLSFEEGYTQLFGDTNLMLLSNGNTVHISLDERTGAGFASQDLFLHGFFSASIKLPSHYTAGVVVAFYMSNGDVFEKTHDELDFEFLGNVRGREWRVQTNVYGNGSTAIGREERFYIDKVPIREVVKNQYIGGAFPSKPMSLYVTIWDGSTWATGGGRYKVNYKYAPYVAEFANLILQGCVVDPTDHSSACDDFYSDGFGTMTVSFDEKLKMESFRRKYMTYSYCYDVVRYSKPLPECITDHHGIEHVRAGRRGRQKYGNKKQSAI